MLFRKLATNMQFAREDTNRSISVDVSEAKEESLPWKSFSNLFEICFFSSFRYVRSYMHRYKFICVSAVTSFEFRYFMLNSTFKNVNLPNGFSKLFNSKDYTQVKIKSWQRKNSDFFFFPFLLPIK